MRVASTSNVKCCWNLYIKTNQHVLIDVQNKITEVYAIMYISCQGEWGTTNFDN